MRRRTFSSSLVQHSHIVNTFHPALRNLRLVARSRRALPSLFVDQNAEFVTGFNFPRWQECICQKHP
jgi:hypothetical protein